jgi:hypothetical protein
MEIPPDGGVPMGDRGATANGCDPVVNLRKLGNNRQNFSTVWLAYQTFGQKAGEPFRRLCVVAPGAGQTHSEEAARPGVDSFVPGQAR